MIFKRKMYERLLKWKKERNGSTAFLIEGARRVGKSTLAETFAKNEYKSYLLIDFSMAPHEVHELFRDISDLNYLFLRLQFIYKVTLIERQSVIIFDEVQSEPYARQAVKHLVKDGRYDYIETVSLISVRKNVAGILIPSEETRAEMYPLDYEEFLWACGDTATMPLLRMAFEKRTPLGVAHRRQMRTFRLYMLVGGMPQAVDEYLRTNNLAKVDTVKRDIISLYEEDFGKIDMSGRAAAVYDAIPAQLSRHVSRFYFSDAIPGERASGTATLIRQMEQSMTINVCYHSNDPNVGLSLTKDDKRYKLYASDTGLFVTLAFKDKAFSDNVIYEKMLNDKLNVNLGFVYENVVAQMLRASGKRLFYHTMPFGGNKNRHEVDFLLTERNKVSPIEVKSSGYKTHASLNAFCDKYSGRILNKYVIYTKDLRREEGIDYVPVYMTECL